MKMLLNQKFSFSFMNSLYIYCSLHRLLRLIVIILIPIYSLSVVRFGVVINNFFGGLRSSRLSHCYSNNQLDKFQYLVQKHKNSNKKYYQIFYLAMSTINDENRRKLQQKYQKYKASHQASSNILGNLDQNKKQTQIQEDVRRIQLNQSFKSDDIYSRILVTSPRNNVIFGAMLSDPKIYQLSQYLHKQAEQRNKQALITAFPQRYQSLLQTQARYKIYQQKGKQNIQKKNKQVEMLMQKLVRLQNKLKQQAQIMNNQQQNKYISQQKKFSSMSEQIKKKDMQLHSMKDQLEILQKKYQKIKKQHKNANEIILQLRQSQESNHYQTQRLVQKIKQLEQKLSKAHKKMLQFDQDKRLALKFNQEQYEQKIQQMKQRQKHLEQLLQQANIRTQYKQSLLKMSEEEQEKVLKKLDDQIRTKHDQIQNLREEHLQALRTIDELQQRINRQEEQLVRDIQMNDTQKEQLKKQLQKYHQLNGQVRAQLDVKSQLVRVLQKSIQCMKRTFQCDVNAKNSQWLQSNNELIKLKNQNKALSQQLKKQKNVQLGLQQQNKNLKNQIRQLRQKNKIDIQKLAYSQQILKKYLNKIIQQEQLCLQLKWKIQQFIQSKGNDDLNQVEDVKEDKNWKPDTIKQKKLKEYQIIIEKLKNQVIILTSNSRQSARKESKIVHELIQENKRLKREKGYVPRIELFSENR